MGLVTHRVSPSSHLQRVYFPTTTNRITGRYVEGDVDPDSVWVRRLGCRTEPGIESDLLMFSGKIHVEMCVKTSYFVSVVINDRVPFPVSDPVV